MKEKRKPPTVESTEQANPVHEELVSRLMKDAGEMGETDFTREMADLSATLIMESQEKAGEPVTPEMLDGGDMKGKMDQAIGLRLEAVAAAQENAKLTVGEDGLVEKRVQ